MTQDQKDTRPILCGTDFSGDATEAANVAGAIARKLGVKLFLVHVDEFSELATSDPGLYESALAGKRKALKRDAERLRKLETAVEDLLPSGVVFEDLIQSATKFEARMIVVGAVGHGLARRLLVGSVAERVAENSPVPTLVVRPGGAVGAWIAGEERLRVLAGYDFSNASDAAMRWLGELAGIGSCEINIAYVDWPPDQAHRLGYRGPVALDANPAQLQSFLERDLRERVAMDPPPDSVSLSVVAGWGRTDAHLLQIAQAQKAGLIVVGTHGRHGLGRFRFGSVSRGILHHAPVSVAVIPTSARDREQVAVPRVDRVLVATDFSELGNEAVRYACAILRPGGTLALVHVFDGDKPDPKLLAQLSDLVPPATARQFEVKPEIIKSNHAAEAIAQAAERGNVDVICLGSHGRSGLAKTLLGSVAQGVMATSKRPVLVTRLRG